METVVVDRQEIDVAVIERLADRQCSLLEEIATGELILEYVDSVGPYKIDIIKYHKLSAAEADQYRKNGLDVTRLVDSLRG